MQFQDDVVGGTILVRPAIQSPEYQPGVQGWSINADGTAEFSDLTVRSSDGSGNLIELENGEILLYAGSTLVGRFSATLQGLMVGADGSPQVEIRSAGDSGRVTFPSGSTHQALSATILTADFSKDTPGENISLQIIGPSTSPFADRLEMLLSSQNVDGSSPANLVLRVGGAETLWTADRTSGTDLHGRVQVRPSAGADPVVTVDGAAGQTGDLMRWKLNGISRGRINADGQLQTSSLITDTTVTAGSGLFVGARDQGRGWTGGTMLTGTISGIGTSAATIMWTAGGVTFEDGRAYRVEYQGFAQSTTADGYALYRLHKGTTAAGPIVRGNIRCPLIQVASSQTDQSWSCVMANTTGADIVTDLAVSAAFGGTGTGLVIGSATAPCTLNISDIGSASDWYAAQNIT